MIVINLSVTVLISPEHLERPLIEPSYAKMHAEERRATEELRRATHQITCERCGWTGYGYETAGRAKMGL